MSNQKPFRKEFTDVNYINLEKQILPCYEVADYLLWTSKTFFNSILTDLIKISSIFSMSVMSYSSA